MHVKKYIKDFCRCGCYGWLLECFWTGCQSLPPHNRKQKKLPCQTSLWMFPIYGMAVFIEPLYHFLRKRNFVIRGTVYTLGFFAAEYGTGKLLKKKKCCPWDYSKAKSNIDGIVRLDFAPLWFFVSLMYEHMLVEEKHAKK